LWYLHSALRYPETLRGIVALSTYLPHADKLEVERNSANQACPIFMAHELMTRSCPCIPPKPAINCWFMGYQIKWFDYPMEHSVSPMEIHDLGKFFRSLLR
jgi:phospholipase/carboxylesterase